MNKSTKELVVKAWVYVDRERLRKISILKGSKNNIQVKVKFLDKDTLSTKLSVFTWTKKTLELVVSCLIEEGELF